ncbi:MAG: phage holin, family [Sedimentibacter sp.]|jgi:LL-H family phage holin|nr:phage holin, family [Sedimentibacter sp.]
MNNLMYQIATLVISILGLVLTGFVVPWVKAKIGTEKMGIVQMWVKVAVAAAEQLKKSDVLNKDDRKQYVLAFIKDKGITITDNELDALIEAAVYELNKAQNLLFTDLALQEGVALLGETSETENQ